MSTNETPAQRRTRLIEEYTKAAIIATPDYSAEQMVAGATFVADAVIAATPQEPQSELQKHIEQHGAEIKARYHKQEPTRYPSETETRLIELVEHCAKCMLGYQDANHVRDKLSAIKRDLRLTP